MDALLLRSIDGYLAGSRILYKPALGTNELFVHSIHAHHTCILDPGNMNIDDTRATSQVPPVSLMPRTPPNHSESAPLPSLVVQVANCNLPRSF